MTETTGDTATAPQTVYSVRNFIDAAQLKTDLAYSPTDLTDAMMKQASLFAHYGALAAEASHQVDVVKMLLESTEATVYKLLRDDFAKRAEKVTEAQLEKLVAQNARTIAMKKALNQAKRIEAVGKTAVEAFRHRKDMLIQIGSTAREEMKGELTIAARSAHQDAMDFTRRAVMDQIKGNSAN